MGKRGRGDLVEVCLVRDLGTYRVGGLGAADLVEVCLVREV